MKKLFKYLMLFALATITSVSLASCGDDEDELPKDNGEGGSNASIVGTWHFESDSMMGDNWNDWGIDEDSYYTFKEDGSYYAVIIDHSGRNGDDIDVGKGTYRISGNKVTTTIDGITATGTFSVSGNTLKTVALGIEQTFKKVSYDKVSKYIEEYERNH